MTTSGARRVTRRVVPLAVRRPLGIGLYRLRIKTRLGLHGVLGQLPVLAARDFVYSDRYYDKIDPLQAPLYARFADALVRLRAPENAVDVGCGSGLMLTKLAERGVRVLGLDGSRAAVRRARKTIPAVRANLEHGVPMVGRFDISLSIEVAEHLRPKAGPRLVEGLTRLSDTVVFTAAPPGQGGTSHINLRPRSYWVALFASQGFIESRLREELLVAIADIREPQFLHRNLMVFEREL